MSKKIIFSAFGRDSYYHRDWFKKNGFKFDRSSRNGQFMSCPLIMLKNLLVIVENMA